MNKEKNREIRDPEPSKHENNPNQIQTMLNSMHNSPHPELPQK